MTDLACQVLLEELDFDAVFKSIQAFDIKWQRNYENCGVKYTPTVEDVIDMIQSMFEALDKQNHIVFSCFSLKRVENKILFSFIPSQIYI